MFQVLNTKLVHNGLECWGKKFSVERRFVTLKIIIFFEILGASLRFLRSNSAHGCLSKKSQSIYFQSVKTIQIVPCSFA